MGGWADDQDAAMTLQLAKDAVTSRQLDVDMEEAFVPGVRRGYLVIPYNARREETDGHMHKRLTTAIQKVRQANRATGGQTRMEQSSTCGWHTGKLRKDGAEQDTRAR